MISFRVIRSSNADEHGLTCFAERPFDGATVPCPLYLGFDLLTWVEKAAQEQEEHPMDICKRMLKEGVLVHASGSKGVPFRFVLALSSMIR